MENRREEEYSGYKVACTKACGAKWREAGGGWAGMKTLGLVKETQIHKHPQKKGFPYRQPLVSDLISQSLSIFIWKVDTMLIPFP